MPTPQARIIASEKISDEIIKKRLLIIYKRQFEKLKEDLLDRLNKYSAFRIDGKTLWGGGENPAIAAGAIAKAMKDLQGLFSKLTKEVPGAIDGRLDAAFLEQADAWLKTMAGKAPAWVKQTTPNLANEWAGYLRKSSLVEQKLLEGAYAEGGIHSIHARLYEKTRAVLTENLASGRSYNEIIAEVEKRVWGIDVAATGIVDQGALSWVKRLLRTEFQYAHNLARYEVGKSDSRIEGCYVYLENTACDLCQDELGGKPGETVLLLWADIGGEENIPPANTHPNCHCSFVGYAWVKPDIDLAA